MASDMVNLHLTADESQQNLTSNQTKPKIENHVAKKVIFNRSTRETKKKKPTEIRGVVLPRSEPHGNPYKRSIHDSEAAVVELPRKPTCQNLNFYEFPYRNQNSYKEKEALPVGRRKQPPQHSRAKGNRKPLFSNRKHRNIIQIEDCLKEARLGIHLQRLEHSAYGSGGLTKEAGRRERKNSYSLIPK